MIEERERARGRRDIILKILGLVLSLIGLSYILSTRTHVLIIDMYIILCVTCMRVVMNQYCQLARTHASVSLSPSTRER